jgi:D-glycero-alpha-D-manno-heptose 1-phosphate guanylyltransferase
MNDVILLAGGLGSRLSAVLHGVPKSMAPVAGRPFLEYQLEYLKKQGEFHVILSVGFLKDPIISHFKDSTAFPGIDFSIEEHPLGTGGAVKHALRLCSSSEVWVMNGDTLFLADLQSMLTRKKETGSDAVLALRHVGDTGRYGRVETSNNGRITKFREKEDSSGDGLINGGIYLLNRGLIEDSSFPEQFSLEKDLFTEACNTHLLTGIEFDGYFRDIGIPGDLEKAQTEFPEILKMHD